MKPYTSRGVPGEMRVCSSGSATPDLRHSARGMSGDTHAAHCQWSARGAHVERPIAMDTADTKTLRYPKQSPCIQCNIKLPPRDLDRKKDIEEGNVRLLNNLLGATTTIPRGIPSHKVKESSQSVNRRSEAQRVAHENMKMVGRLDNIRCGKNSHGIVNKVGVHKNDNVPIGWTRGIGGRLLPPTKLRWKNSQYDAGDWQP